VIGGYFVLNWGIFWTTKLDKSKNFDKQLQSSDFENQIVARFQKDLS